MSNGGLFYSKNAFAYSILLENKTLWQAIRMRTLIVRTVLTNFKNGNVDFI